MTVQNNYYIRLIDAFKPAPEQQVAKKASSPSLVSRFSDRVVFPCFVATYKASGFFIAKVSGFYSAELQQRVTKAWEDPTDVSILLVITQRLADLSEPYAQRKSTTYFGRAITSAAQHVNVFSNDAHHLFSIYQDIVKELAYKKGQAPSKLNRFIHWTTHKLYDVAVFSYVTLQSASNVLLVVAHTFKIDSLVIFAKESIVAQLKDLHFLGEKKAPIPQNPILEEEKTSRQKLFTKAAKMLTQKTFVSISTKTLKVGIVYFLASTVIPSLSNEALSYETNMMIFSGLYAARKTYKLIPVFQYLNQTYSDQYDLKTHTLFYGKSTMKCVSIILKLKKSIKAKKPLSN